MSDEPKPMHEVTVDDLLIWREKARTNAGVLVGMLNNPERHELTTQAHLLANAMEEALCLAENPKEPAKAKRAVVSVVREFPPEVVVWMTTLLRLGAEYRVQREMEHILDLNGIPYKP